MWTDKEIDEFYELLNNNDLIYANELAKISDLDDIKIADSEEYGF